MDFVGVDAPLPHSNAASIQFYTPSIRPATGKLVRNLGRISCHDEYIYIYVNDVTLFLLRRVETIVAMKSLPLFRLVSSGMIERSKRRSTQFRKQLENTIRPRY